MSLIAVTGSTGALGGRVARRLADRGVPQRLVVRDAARAPRLDGAEVAVAAGYHDHAGMTTALRGAETLFLVSGREAADRVDEHRSAIDAAAEAGVRRIVYTSFLGAADDAVFTLGRHHAQTEALVRDRGLAFTFLRDSMYLDFVPFFASAAGVIAGPGGDGRAAYVARDDVAAVAAAVLADPDAHDGRTYDVTGDERLGLAEAAAVLTEVTGRAVRYEEETEAEAYASRAPSGAPDFEIEGWVTSYQAMAAGELDVVTDVVETITGRPPLRLRAFLEQDRESWAHLRG
ncbi:NmrA family NAD(P)-binding protein [Patulibacter minatonensis]|uniref:NmrA family NAD(P)-binding protein n=1 Tax=Patulibacter minatonensis TaxID=298163 RepID=UPI00047AD021|nr:NAD(P)H-binding protein [Patulibacter minatonensis]